MKKNNRGFFLAETIVVIALVTTVMAFVYPNVTNLYDNYKNRTNYYDQTEDLYLLRAIHNELESKNRLNELTNDGCTEFSDKSEITEYRSKYNIDRLYITGYMTEVSDGDYNFNKYLKRLKKTTYDKASYRLIAKFKSGKYASIKIDNPNSSRDCNLGGK